MEPSQRQDRSTQPQRRVSVACPHCGQGYRVQVRIVGRRLACRQCKREWRAKELAPSDFRSGLLVGAGTSSSSGTALLNGQVPVAGSSATVIDTRWAGKRLGRYDVASVLGHGGMGVVWRANDGGLRRDVALKILNRQGSVSGNGGGLDTQLFMQEARAIAKLQHPSVVSIFEVAEDCGQIFLALELMDGGTLKEHVERYGRIPPRELWAKMVGPARALALAHRRGIIHRDIKSSNLMFDDHGNLKLMDFGLADVAQETAGERTASERMRGKTVGSMGWIAPETAKGEGTTSASDIYGMGLVMLYALTGRVWLRAKSRGELMALHANPPPLDISGIKGLTPKGAAILRTCLAVEQTDRYLTADRLADALQECAEEDPELASRLRTRNIMVNAVVGICCALLMAAIILPYSLSLVESSGEFRRGAVHRSSAPTAGPRDELPSGSAISDSEDGPAVAAKLDPESAVAQADSEASIERLRRPWPQVYGDSDFKFVGSKKSHTFHLATDKCGRSIYASNLEIFETAEEAINEGWKPCPNCQPADVNKVGIASGPETDND